jgi:hypothetical protein
VTEATESALRVLKRLQKKAAKEHRFWSALRADKLKAKEPTYEVTRNMTTWGEEAMALQIAIDSVFRLSQLEK